MPQFRRRLPSWPIIFGGLWLEDFEADWRGELPRGVRSVDAAYDALYDRRRLLKRMRTWPDGICWSDHESPSLCMESGNSAEARLGIQRRSQNLVKINKNTAK